MTRVKKSQSSIKKTEKYVKPSFDLRSEFMKLTKDEQDKITHFFNLHNIAIYFYNSFSDDARNYVDYCINLSAEASLIHSAQV